MWARESRQRILGTNWNFPTGSDTAPTAGSGGTAAGTAVYDQSFAQGPADVENAGGLSPYGVMGMGGNVSEWEETASLLNNSSGSSSRGFRGGDWFFNSDGLSASFRSVVNPSFESNLIGFRVTSLSSAVPEPSSLILTMFATVCGLLRRQRRRK